MDKETRQWFNSTNEHIDKLSGEISTLNKDMTNELRQVRETMVSKEYLKQALEALQADLGPEEDMLSSVHVKPMDDDQ